MQLTLLNGYPDYIGKRFAFAGYGNGPASYAITGDPVEFPAYNNYIDALFEAMSVSGNYTVKFVPSSYGERSSWSAFWFYSGKQGVTGVTATGGTGMTPGTYPLSFSGGGGSGAAGTITVLTATTYTISVTNSGAGYTSAPTVTAATGGTPPTFTAIVAPGSGMVPATTNLSAETVQCGGFGGVY